MKLVDIQSAVCYPKTATRPALPFFSMCALILKLSDLFVEHKSVKKSIFVISLAYNKLNYFILNNLYYRSRRKKDPANEAENMKYFLTFQEYRNETLAFNKLKDF